MELGLYFYNARWYDSALGRFTSPDSIIPVASQGVQAWDRMAYANNNPIVHNDPSGHCPLCIVIVVGIVAAIVMPWLSGDTCNTCNAAHPVTSEQFETEAVQRANLSADILMTTTIVVGAAEVLGINSKPNYPTLN